MCKMQPFLSGHFSVLGNFVDFSIATKCRIQSRIRTQPPELMVQSPLMFAPQFVSLCAAADAVVSPPYREGDNHFFFSILGAKMISPKPIFFAHKHSLFSSNQQVLKLYSKELPDMNYASNTRKQSTFLERCVSKRNYCSLVLKSGVSDESFHFLFMIDVCYCRPLQVTGTLFLPYDSDTELRSSTLMPETSRPIYHAPASDSEKAPYVAKANERKVEYEKTRNSKLPESFTRRRGGEEEEKTSVLPKNDGCGCSLVFTV
ncbi:hypothetical protein DY000_02007173 [Brassica cretica]|uniref:Uncharacterized protein n=1 Tax=Brassica cretica TaxID=69181 RepID=A0ABQ7CL86_BRACR|nr:hypothetical protein DY000_02007173 [Brassica cretica]